MKRLFTSLPVLLFIFLNLSGCNTVGGKTASLSIIYGAAATLSFLLLIGCCFSVHKNRTWFIMLFSSVLFTNCGYTLLSFSDFLEMALWANRISYLGSVFLPLSMLMIILKLTNTNHSKNLHLWLSALSLVVFLIAASPGVLDIYYKEVTFDIVKGSGTLIKVYGVLHPLYLFYLLGYFAAMVAVIVHAQIKKTIDSTIHAVMVALAVFVNIGVWFIEQIVSIDFEILSISYIISEMFLLGVHIVMNENQKLREIVKQVEAVKNYNMENAETTDMLDKPLENNIFEQYRIDIFLAGLADLTPTEKAICEAYIARVTTKEIMANLNIKQSTLKFHNSNIYGKLGVASRKELLELHKYVKTLKSKIDL